MKNFLKSLTKLLQVLYKILPLFIGIYCYYPVFKEQDSSVYPVLDSIYASIMLYTGNADNEIPIGGLLQFARFLALAATLSIVINAFNKMSDLINRIKLCSPDSTVVYGDSAYTDNIYKNLGKWPRIRGEEKLIKNASRYLIMFSEDIQNLEFYSKNYNSLKDKKVYIMLNDVSQQNIENPLVTVFSIAENCARQYWRNHPVDKSERIAIIGFGDIGKNILIYGLQVNLIDPGQHFEYHIYGDGTEFRREHTELDKMLPDEIIFHDDGIYKFADMSDFDRIIICDGTDSKDNIAVLSRLLVAAPINNHIYIYAPNGDVISNLFGNDKIICFGAAEETASIDIILNDKSMETARKQHEFYFSQYGGTPWEKLDSFKRYSNVSSSDYMYTINRLLDKGTSPEKIAELEHIRWCRYHYIHNWKYGEERNNEKRIHNCLIPFSELSEEEKIKDIEAIKSKFERSKNNGVG